MLMIKLIMMIHFWGQQRKAPSWSSSHNLACLLGSPEQYGGGEDGDNDGGGVDEHVLDEDWEDKPKLKKDHEVYWLLSDSEMVIIFKIMEIIGQIIIWDECYKPDELAEAEVEPSNWKHLSPPLFTNCISSHSSFQTVFLHIFQTVFLHIVFFKLYFFTLYFSNCISSHCILQNYDQDYAQIP